MPYFGGAIVT